jgi:hypothetical protein
LITLTTPPRYKAGQNYELLDRRLDAATTERRTVAAGADGRLRIQVDGLGHQLSIHGPGAGAQPPVLLPVTAKDHLRVSPGRETALPLRVYNPRLEPMRGVRVEVTSEYPTVALKETKAEVEEIAPGESVDLSARFRVVFTSGAGDYAPARVHVRLVCGPTSAEEYFDVMIEPSPLPAPLAVEILDGRSVTLPVFRQKGNQGGGFTLERKITEGRGNGNGVLEPGEEAAIWVKLEQGLDPFDKNHWYRVKVYSDSEWLEESADLEEQKQREWTGAKERTSVVRLSPRTPPGASVTAVLSNESWSFHFTPDVRYGKEPLYQAYQLHRRHVHRFAFTTGGRR